MQLGSPNVTWHKNVTRWVLETHLFWGQKVVGLLFVLCGQGSSLLWTPALRPFESVQCASPGRGWELIGVCVCVCGVCYVGWPPWPVNRSAPGPDWHLFSAIPTGLPFSGRPPDWHVADTLYLDAADEGISNGHNLKRTPSNPLTCLGLTSCSSCA